MADDGTFWMADEYRPAIYHFDSQRHADRAVHPDRHARRRGQPVPRRDAGAFGTEALPAVLAQRRQNRGFEGIALQDGKLYAFVQSPLRNPARSATPRSTPCATSASSSSTPRTGATRQFLYVMDNPAAVGADDTRADKIGDAVAVADGEFLVVERDDDAIRHRPAATITKKVYRFNLAGATDITDAGPVRRAAAFQTVDQMTAAELTAAGITPIAKTLHVDLAAGRLQHRREGRRPRAARPATLAVINDNDFGVAGIVIDPPTGTFTRAAGYVPEAVDARHHRTCRPRRVGPRQRRSTSATGRCSACTSRTRSPPSRVDGKTYLVTANEGDARDWPASPRRRASAR